MAAFELKAFMSTNREAVISEYNEMSKSEFFNGVPLKSFMSSVMGLMELNNVKSEKKAKDMLPRLIEREVARNTKIEVLRDRDAELAAKYKGTAYMALV